MDLGSREEEMILSPVSRCGVRREEEIGARLSDGFNMNSTGLVDNPDADMSAMRFCGGWIWGRTLSVAAFSQRNTPAILLKTFSQKKRPRSRGERSPKGDRSETRQEGTQQAQGREEKHPL